MCRLILTLFLLCSTQALLSVTDPDPDAALDTPKMIERQGYPVESHYVTTNDGYILNVFRIPHNKTSNIIGSPVLLVHGLLISSDCWLLQELKSLAYRLVDFGFDVWLGNVRGNIYSRNHTHFTTSQQQFWDFSFEQMGDYDLPAMIDYILTKSKYNFVNYIGHSLGTTSLMAMLSSKPDYNTKIQAAVLLAPEVYLDHTQSLALEIIKPLGSPTAAEANYQVEFESSIGLFTTLKLSCLDVLDPLNQELCKYYFTQLFGPSYEFSVAMAAKFANHFPHGTSFQTAIHIAQMKYSGKFSRYDYGKDKNLIKYNSTTPPLFPLDKVEAPIHFFYSDNDYSSHPTDVERLAGEISSTSIELYKISPYNHMDYVLIPSADKLVNDKIITIFGGN